jgi:hypothetical protein
MFIIPIVVIIVIFAILRIADNSSKPEYVKEYEYEYRKESGNGGNIFAILGAILFAIGFAWFIVHFFG